jgi:hypothetical protein
MLVRLNKLASLLAAKRELASEQFVEKLNLGLVELPKMYEDDKLLFEVNTEEGDTLALSCYYAIFTRNGVDHFPVPLQDFSILKIETYPASPKTKGVLVVDPRHGQTVLQGTTGSFRYEGEPEDEEYRHYYIDHFTEAASLLNQIHDCIHWAITHEEELFSVFLLLHAVVENLAAKRQALPGPQKTALPPAQAQKADDDFEVVEETLPDKWYIARNKKRHGPVTWKQLQGLAATGKLHPTDMILQEGNKKWNAASSVPGLFQSKEASPAS